MNSEVNLLILRQSIVFTLVKRDRPKRWLSPIKTNVYEISLDWLSGGECKGVPLRREMANAMCTHKIVNQAYSFLRSRGTVGHLLQSTNGKAGVGRRDRADCGSRAQLLPDHQYRGSSSCCL